MSTLSIVVPAGIDTPEGYTLPDSVSGLGQDLYNWETAVATAVSTATYILTVTSLSVYKARANGTDQTTVIKGFGLRGPKGKAMSKTDVTRLDILGLSVSHGVTDVQSVRSAINYAMNKRGKGADIVRAIIRNWAVDEKRSDSGLIKTLRAGEDKSLQEMFEQAIKSAASNMGRASDIDGVVITDDVATHLEAIRSSMETLSV